MNTKHLKAKILDLAIRGKLVEQKAEDGNAFDLLQKIREEKMPHGKMSHGLDFANAKSRKNKQQPETALAKVEDAFASDLQFEIPENWCWCRLGEICETQLGKTLDRAKNTGMFYPYLCSINVNWGKFDLSTVKQIQLEKDELEKYSVKRGDLLVCEGGEVGRCAIWNTDEIIYYQNALHRIRFYSGVNNFYIMYLLNFYKNNKTIDNVSKGVTIKHLVQGALVNLLVPLPPLPEQKRIVSAIEKAFAQIDIIEKNKLNLKTYIKQTKSKVLDLAIRGKLVEQNAEDGNAFDLLQKIRDEKTSHGLDFANAKSRKNKHQTETALAKVEDAFASDLQCDNKNVSDVPFEIPENWCWCKGKSIFLPMTSRTPSGSEFKYIDIETVDNKLQKIHYPKILKTENAPSRASRETLVGDTIFSMVRPYLKNIALITEDLSDCIASTGFFICRPNKALNPKYLYYLMISNYVVNGLNQFMKGDNSPAINGDDITEFYFPLPPLPEQKRIVAKIEQIFEQLDILEKSLGE